MERSTLFLIFLIITAMMTISCGTKNVKGTINNQEMSSAKKAQYVKKNVPDNTIIGAWFIKKCGGLEEGKKIDLVVKTSPDFDEKGLLIIVEPVSGVQGVQGVQEFYYDRLSNGFCDGSMFPTGDCQRIYETILNTIRIKTPNLFQKKNLFQKN
jgi:hypothetical protein